MTGVITYLYKEDPKAVTEKNYSYHLTTVV